MKKPSRDWIERLFMQDRLLAERNLEVQELRAAQAELDRIDRVLTELGAFDQGMELTRGGFIAELARRK